MLQYTGKVSFVSSYSGKKSTRKKKFSYCTQVPFSNFVISQSNLGWYIKLANAVAFSHNLDNRLRMGSAL